MSTHIQIACPSCHQELKARREYIGRAVSCKRCNHTFTIRAPDEQALKVESETPAAAPRESSSNGREEQLVVERDRLRSELEKVRGQLAQAASKVDPAELEHVRLERDRLHGELEAARRELESIRTERDRLQEETGRLASHKDAVATSASLAAESDLKAERSRWDAERDELAKRFESQLAAAQESARKELEESRRQFHSERQSLTKQLDELRTRADALEKERAGAAERFEALVEERDRLASGHAAAQSRFAQAESTHQAELARHAEEHAAERERLASEHSALQARLEQTESARQAALTGLAEKHAAERNVLVDQFEALRASRDDAELEHQRARQQLSEELEQTRTLTDTAAQRGDELAGEVRELREECERLQGQHQEALAALRREYDAARTGLQHQNAELQDKLRSANAQVDQLQVGHQAAAEARGVLDSELDDARRQIVTLQQELVESQNAGNQIRSLLKHIGIHLP